MRAVVCPSVPISPSQLVYTTTHPMPQPRSGHVLIRVNRSDLFTRQGISLGLSSGLVLPRVLGIECVGVVKDAGGGVWKEGDVVAAIMGGMGRQFDGGYAEYTLVPHASVSLAIKLPQNVGWETFAAIPETFITVTSTDSLLIRGGSSSVGLACAALAKSSLFNVPTAISTTRAAHKVASMKASGTDNVVLDTGSINAEVELVGMPTLKDSCAALAPDGVIAMIGMLSGVWKAESDPFAALSPSKHLTIFGSNTIDMSSSPLQKIVDAVSTGEIKLSVDKVFDMASAGEANSAARKVVCLVDGIV
ncbi:chaperonin 10-like protein [Mycena rosella]|uniref:Chaperonin 10-like protein n=1 Tax=Mycena rosella TaxID=1033263 RepID=A0AAD7CD95_MYCRO|nr:chaperonin 10-like protein [Mycena rosella]